MIKVRKSQERGHFDHGWLKTYHTFSFADYQDPIYMGFKTLRVINEDRVQPGQGFGTHSHRDMEILTYVLEGALEHKDSMGNTSVIKPGEVQRMSAGTGVTHSEYNASKNEPVHFLQIWIFPSRMGLKPGYEQKAFGKEGKKNKLRLIASPDGREGTVTVHQDILMYDATLKTGKTLEHSVDFKTGQWVQLMRGKLNVNGQPLSEGDGASLEGEPSISFEADKAAEFILFDFR